MTVLHKKAVIYLDEPYNFHKARRFQFAVRRKASNDPDVSVDLDQYPEQYSKQYPEQGQFWILLAAKILIPVLVVLVFFLAYVYKPETNRVNQASSGESPSTLGENLRELASNLAGSVQGLVQNNDSNRQLEKPSSKLSGLSADLEQIGFRVIAANYWLNGDMDRFLELWRLLDGNARAKINDTVWFQHLSYKLKHEVKKLLRSGEKQDPRVAMARKLGVVEDIESISISELNTNIASFARAYKDGNIRILDKLFAENIIYNNGRSKSDIRKHYLNLFSSTHVRNISIDNIQWEIYDGYAKVTGVMNSLVVDYDNKAVVSKGKIRFVMKKFNNRLLVTHLYQLLRKG